MEINQENQVLKSKNKILDHAKKWCFIKEDFFHGPFTDQEMIDLFLKEKIQDSDYVLNKLNESWYLVSELDIFKAEFIRQQVEKQKKKELEIFEKNIAQKVTEQVVKGDFFWEPVAEKKDDLTSREILNPKIEVENKKIVKQLSRNGYVFIAVLAFAAVLPYFFQRFSETHQNKKLALLNQGQMVLAKSVMDKSYDKYGASIKIFVLEQNNNIILQVVSNLKSNVELTAKIEGQSQTLVGAFNFNRSLKLISDSGLFQPITLNRSIPKGEYKITLSCFDCRKIDLESGKEISSDILFLNGVKDKVYDRELAKYHQIVRTKAREELNYFKQVMSLFQEQMDILSLRFNNNIKQQITVSKYWDRYYSAWQPLSLQFDSEMERLKSEVISGEVFYDDIVADLQNLNYLAKEYSTYLDVTVRDFFRSQLYSTEASKKTDRMKDLTYKKINSIVERINAYEKMPLTSNGMPQKN